MSSQIAEKEFNYQISAFEEMLLSGNKKEVRDSCSKYNFDFFNGKTVSSTVEKQIETDHKDGGESDSPFTWAERENECEYFQPKAIKRETKKRISV